MVPIKSSVRNDIYGYFDGINLWTEEGKPSKLEIIDEYQESDFKDFNDCHYFINYGYYTISDNIFASLILSFILSDTIK